MTGCRTSKEVAFQALREAIGLPFAILLASFISFGTLASGSGFGLASALVSTAAIWGLPGQIAMAELYAAGVGAGAVVLAVAVANARFVLMAASFMPLLRPALKRKPAAYLLVSLLSTFSWAAGRRVFPSLRPRQRLVYFQVYALVCISGAVIGTALGFLATASVPEPVQLGLLFINPLFFALVFADAKERHIVLSLLAGAVLGPSLHALTPDWGVVIAGFVAGSAAFYLGWQRPRGRARD